MKFATYNILCHLGDGVGSGGNFAIGTCVLYRLHMHLAKMSHVLMLPCFLFFSDRRWERDVKISTL